MKHFLFYSKTSISDLMHAKFFGRNYAREIAKRAANSVNEWLPISAIYSNDTHIKSQMIEKEIRKLGFVPDTRINESGIQVIAWEC